MHGAQQPPELDAVAIMSVLNRHKVRYFIGAFAAIVQQAPIAPTRDIDLTPEGGKGNLERLSAALKELDARIRTHIAPDGLAFNYDGASLGGADMCNLICPHGEFDISFRPAAFEGGFSEVVIKTHSVNVAGVEVLVADLADVIRSKEAAGRAKDLQVLPALHRHQTRQRNPPRKS